MQNDIACIMTVCIEMENLVIDTASYDCRNIILKIWGWSVYSSALMVKKKNDMLRRKIRILIGLLKKISRFFCGLQFKDIPSSTSDVCRTILTH